MLFLPCVCDIGCKDTYGKCDMVRYHPQDIKKGENFAFLQGFNGAILAYKKCDYCKWMCPR